MLTIQPDDLKFDYSPHHEPVATIRPGERVLVRTVDCFTGRFQTPEGFTEENVHWTHEYLDGVTGPIAVEGVQAGDTVAVTLHSVKPNSVGSVVLSRCEAHSVYDWWEEEFACDGLVIEGDTIDVFGISLPIDPVVGCIAVAPARESVLSIKQGRYGGNLDCDLIREGATILLGAEVDGANLYLGDSKAVLGRGEVCQPPEIGTDVEISVEIVEGMDGADLVGPRLVSEDTIASVVSHPSLVEAGRMAFKDLLNWLDGATEMSRPELGVFMASVADLGVCQVSNSLPTALCEIPRKYVELLEPASGHALTDAG
jgi:amidase